MGGGDPGREGKWKAKSLEAVVFFRIFGFGDKEMFEGDNILCLVVPCSLESPVELLSLAEALDLLRPRWGEQPEAAAHLAALALGCGERRGMEDGGKEIGRFVYRFVYPVYPLFFVFFKINCLWVCFWVCLSVVLF